MSVSQFVGAVGAAFILGVLVATTSYSQEVASSTGGAAETALPAPEDDFGAALIRAAGRLPEARREAIQSFYAGRDFAPLWTGEGSTALTELQSALEGATDHGLPPARYGATALIPPVEGADGQAETEIAATVAFLRFAGDLSAGILTPVKVDPEISVETTRPTDAALLVRLAAAPAPEVFAALTPADPDYAALIAEKRRLEALRASDPWGAAVPDGETLHPGDSDARVPLLRDRLARLGYASEPVGTHASADPTTFDDALAAEVAAFQRDYGLLDDGAVGRRTLQAINASAADRLEQVVVNLERLRWTNVDLGARRIEVNIPDFTATLYDEDAVVWQSRVVVGEAGKTRTPEFSDEMTHMVVNPTWHIPDSIAIRTYLPKLQKDPNVLANSNMRLFTRSGQEINPRLVNFDQYTPASFPFRFKQNPYSANALGRVKFMFPNQFSIYLHDTPHRELFERDARAFSNGCVRLEKPFELAYALLDGQVEDPEAAFGGWVDAKTERQVNLDRPVQVHLMYRTAWADGDAIRYRDDIYGRDAKVFEALAAEGVTLPEPPVQG